jgi:hypothetical protein
MRNDYKMIVFKQLTISIKTQNDNKIKVYFHVARINKILHYMLNMTINTVGTLTRLKNVKNYLTVGWYQRYLPIFCQNAPKFSPELWHFSPQVQKRYDSWALRLSQPEPLLYSLRRSRRLYSGAEGRYNLNAHG